MAILDKLKEALSMAKDLQTLDALRERLAHAQDLMAEAEKKLSALAEENAALLKENRDLRIEVDSHGRSSILIDIGPCFIKTDKEETRLVGFYCSNCKTVLDRANYSGEGASLHCPKCQAFVVAALADQALADYQARKGGAS